MAKLSPSGNGLAYATFLGGNERDFGWTIAVDRSDSAYISGHTWSSDFPTTPGAFDTSSNGGGDAFVVKLNPAGSGLAYATFLGGNDWDGAEGIAVDGSGSAYVTGFTCSVDFPTTPGAFDTTGSGSDAFVVKLNPAGSELTYATFLGGEDWDVAYGIVVNNAGGAFVSGYTASSDFPTTFGAFDTTYNNGGDAFVVSLNPAGNGLTYATFLGGSDRDAGLAIALDEGGNAYVTGYTTSIDFPTTPGAFDTSFHGGSCGDGPCPDSFVVKLNQVGGGLSYATYLGGNSADCSIGVAVDGVGNAYLTGLTLSSNFPTTPGAFDTTYNGETCPGWPNDWWCGDAFVFTLNPSGGELIYATFLGGSSDEMGNAIVVDGTGKAYTTGATTSSDFPTSPGSFDTSYNANKDAFVAKIDVNKRFIHAPWTGQPPTVDGNLDDWGQWSPLVLSHATADTIATQPPGSPPPSVADNSAELRALWTGTNLYFAVFVRDDVIVNDSTDVWRDDEIELAFVGAWDGIPDGGDTYQYTVNADGRITGFGDPAHPVPIQAAVHAGGRWLERGGKHPGHPVVWPQCTPHRRQNDDLRPWPARRRRRRQLGQPHDLGG